MTFANSLDPDEAKPKCGAHLVSKLFDNQIIQQQLLDGNNECLQTLKDNKSLSVQRLMPKRSREPALFEVLLWKLYGLKSLQPESHTFSSQSSFTAILLGFKS